MSQAPTLWSLPIPHVDPYLLQLLPSQYHELTDPKYNPTVKKPVVFAYKPAKEVVRTSMKDRGTKVLPASPKPVEKDSVVLEKSLSRSFRHSPPALNLRKVLSVPDCYTLTSKRTAREGTQVLSASIAPTPPRYASETVALQALQEHEYATESAAAEMEHEQRTAPLKSGAMTARSVMTTNTSMTKTARSKSGSMTQRSMSQQLLAELPTFRSFYGEKTVQQQASLNATSQKGFYAPVSRTAPTTGGRTSPVSSPRSYAMKDATQMDEPTDPHVTGLCDRNITFLLHKGVESILCAPFEGFTDVSVRAIARTCPRLQKLDLARCLSVTPGALMEFATACRELRQISLRGCVLVSTAVVECLLRELHHLEAVDFSECPRVGENADSVFSTCVPVRSLEKIGFNKCPSISDQFVASLVMLAPSLRSIELSQCVLITDASLDSISQYVPGLWALDVSACKKITDSGVQWLTDRATGLRQLRMALCANIGDTSTRNIASKCPDLEEIDLSGTQVTDFSIRTLALYCQKLFKLVLQMCRVRGQFKSRVNMRALEILDLSGSALSEWHIVAPNLATLSLADCSEMEDKHIPMIAELCPVIQALNLQRCVRLTDVTPIAIGLNKKKWSRIRTLSLDGCTQITADAIAQVKKLLWGGKVGNTSTYSTDM